MNISLLSFIRQLEQRHVDVLNATRSAARAERLAKSLNSLRLTRNFLEKGELIRQHPGHPLQIAIIGPTQAGKSSITNLLLGAELARISPLAGFTVHPQGFDFAGDESKWAEAYFGSGRRYGLDDFPPGRFDVYALLPCSAPSPMLGNAVVWDTPDFDSVDAEDYRASVLRTIALADVVLLVVSKDKYADQSVWETMQLLEPLGQASVICLNKVPEQSTAALVRSLEQKWRAVRTDAIPPIITLPYLEQWDRPRPAALADTADQLIGLLAKAASQVRRNCHDENAQNLIRFHWKGWTAPIYAEQNALSEWRQLVEQATADALNVYQREFLDHPQHYETFQRALAELLNLLEIPGVARAFLTARSIVTWPVRQLGRLGKALSGQKGKTSQEISVLEGSVDHLLLQLTNAALENSEAPGEVRDWWRELAQLLRGDRRILGEQSRAAIAGYHKAFQPEIERTAHQLFERLREQPAVLNGLRATRVTTDAAALAVALHTGGIGVQDFILAPAMLSLTTLLAESALGHFLNRAEAELKQRQHQVVADMLADQLGLKLLRLPERLEAGDRFDMPMESLQAAEKLLGCSS